MDIDNRVSLRSVALGAVIGLGLVMTFVLDGKKASSPTPELGAKSETVLPELPVFFAKTETLSTDDSGEITPEQVLQAVAEVWPNDHERATKIVLCESRAGEDPDAWAVSHPDGGPMQINRETWADYFHDLYGWTWDQIVLDLEVNLAAARAIYDLTGGWHRWTCADAVLTAAGLYKS